MQNERLKIDGMTCGGCAGKVTHALMVAGVKDVQVSLADGEATVQYDERLTSPEKLKAAVTGSGYAVNTNSATTATESNGCCCAHRAATGRNQAQPGATSPK